MSNNSETLKDSVNETCVKRPQAEKSRWRHIQLQKKTSLSRKPCIRDKKLLWNTISKFWSLFQNLSWKIAGSSPWRRNHDDVITGRQQTLLFWKPCIPWWKVAMKRYQEVMVALSESVMEIRLKRPLAEKSRWRHIHLAIKPRYLGSIASKIKSY